jgi:hypothetical protein
MSEKSRWNRSDTFTGGPGTGVGVGTPQARKGKASQKGWRVLWLLGGLLVTGLAIVGLLARLLAGQFFPDAEVAPEVDIHLASDHLFTVFDFPITNTLLSAWLATLLLVGFFMAARWRARLVPRGIQKPRKLCWRPCWTWWWPWPGSKKPGCCSLLRPPSFFSLPPTLWWPCCPSLAPS